MGILSEKIKYNVEEKQNAVEYILHVMINSPTVLSLSELSQVDTKIMSKLSQEEFEAIFETAKRIKVLHMSGELPKSELGEYLEISKEGVNSVNKENLLKFINEAAEEIKLLKKENSKEKWNLSENQILKRIKARERYSSPEVQVYGENGHDLSE